MQPIPDCKTKYSLLFCFQHCSGISNFARWITLYLYIFFASPDVHGPGALLANVLNCNLFTTRVCLLHSFIEHHKQNASSPFSLFLLLYFENYVSGKECWASCEFGRIPVACGSLLYESNWDWHGLFNYIMGYLVLIIHAWTSCYWVLVMLEL